VRRDRRHALEDKAAAVAEKVVPRLPRSLALGLGNALGRLIGALDRRHVAVAEENLRHAFPDWDPERRLRTARGVYAHFGRMILDILWLRGHSRDEVMSRLEVVGRENVEKAMARGRGAIFVTAHLGNWEVIGLAHGWSFAPISVVARPLDNPALDRRLCAFRAMAGNRVVYKQDALKEILRALHAGQGVAFLIDQNVQEKDGIFVDFFGRPAATTTVVAALAVKTGCALVPGHTTIGPDGRYRAVYDPPLEWTPSGDKQADVARITQELTRVIEGWIREHPEQWLWIHRRWKTQPSAERAATAAGAANGGSAASGAVGREA
jgi:Kdo2-lipid IVA lauroyltransferase/acyltransferase